MEPEIRQILAVTVFKERNMFVAERFLAGLIKGHGRHPVSTDGGTWYPMASNSKLKHHIHSLLAKKEKSPTGRAM